MAEYITNIVRNFRPDAGNPMQLLIDEFNSMDTDAQGILTASLSAATPGGPVSFTSRLFDDASGIDKYLAAVQNSSAERKKQVSDIDAKCSSARLRIVRVLKQGKYVGSNPPTVMVRNFIRPKRGYADEAISIIGDVIDNVPEGETRATLTESTTGETGLLTLSIPSQNWQAAEERYSQFRSSLSRPIAKRMMDITESTSRGPFFILANTIAM